MSSSTFPFYSCVMGDAHGHFNCLIMHLSQWFLYPHTHTPKPQYGYFIVVTHPWTKWMEKLNLVQVVFLLTGKHLHLDCFHWVESSFPTVYWWNCPPPGEELLASTATCPEDLSARRSLRWTNTRRFCWLKAHELVVQERRLPTPHPLQLVPLWIPLAVCLLLQT